MVDLQVGDGSFSSVMIGTYIGLRSINDGLELSFPMVDRCLAVAGFVPGDRVSILAVKGRLLVEKIETNCAVAAPVRRGWGKCLRQVPAS